MLATIRERFPLTLTIGLGAWLKALPVLIDYYLM